MSQSMNDLAVHVQKMGTDIMAKLDSHLPEGVSEGLGNAGAKANEILSAFVAFIIKFLAAMPPFVNKHASTAKSYAREHIFPVVQPHLERFTSEARTRLAPATAWADKNLTPAYRDFETQFEAQTKEYSHLQIAAVAGVALLVFTWIASKLLSWFTTKPDQSYAQRAAVILRSLPIARGMVQKERAKAIAQFQGEVASREVEKITHLLDLPLAGLDADSVMQELEDRAANDFRYADGESKATGTIYMAGDMHRELLNDAYCMFSQANPLHTDLFPSVRRMEAEVVAMTAGLLGGGHQGVREVCGTMTSGGSESNIAAILTSIAYMKATKGVTEPEIIIAETAHACFWKAAKLARARLIMVPVNKKTFKLTAANVISRVTPRTAVIVASSPTYPHGIIDDIADISNVALRCRVCMHVDACLGAFVLPFMRQQRYEVPAFDFSLPGVTSMTADTHKYGLAHKGTSVVLYRTKALRRAQFTPVTEWSGGLYVSPGLSGSRSGGLVATAWAAMRHVGMHGYCDIAKAMVEAAEDFAACVHSVPELQVMGSPIMTVVAFKSVKRTFNVYQLQALLERRGWSYSSLIKPQALHFCFTQQHVNGMDIMKSQFLEACEELRASGAKSVAGKAKMYGSAAATSDRAFVSDSLLDFQDVVLSASGAVPLPAPPANGAVKKNV